MSLGLLPLLALLTVAAPCHCASTRLPEASPCVPDISIVNGPEDIVVTSTGHYNEDADIGLFTHSTVASETMRPRAGFRGLSIGLKASGYREFVAWFPMERDCFGDPADWWRVMVATQLTKRSSSYRFRGFTQALIEIATSKCLKRCFQPGTFSAIQRVQVRAHGPSDWLQTPNDDCGNVSTWNLHTYQGQPPNCIDLLQPPPKYTTTIATTDNDSNLNTTATTNTNSPKFSVIGVVMVILAILLVAGIVCLQIFAEERMTQFCSLFTD